MAEKSTIARPYAKALFELAFDQKALGAWSQALAKGSAVVADEGVRKLLASPLVTTTQLADLVIDIIGAKDNEQLGNFVRVLAANRRLALLPEIATIFEQLKAEAEHVIDVTVTSAVKLDQAQQHEFAAAMGKRLKREVRLQTQVDPALLGGAVLRADDLVIDGSLRGRLERLAAEMAQ